MPKRLELSDSEFREHVQSRARERQNRRSERLRETGHRQVTLWLKNDLYEHIERLAIHLGKPVKDSFPVILHAGITALETGTLTEAKSQSPDRHREQSRQTKAGITEEERQTILDLARQGLTVSEIARRTGRSRAGIQKFLAREGETA